MKKFSLSIALTLLAGSIVLSPSTANAQDDKQGEFEREWYDTCYTKKDVEKCYLQSKELKEKYPKSTYAEAAEKNIKTYEKNKVVDKFQAALTAYFPPNQPDAAKLDQLFAAGEECLKGNKVEPAVQQYVIGRMALAGANGAMGEFYKNLDKVKGYAETALKTFEPAATPEGWKKEDWDPLREVVLAQMNQYLGWYFIIGTKSDPNQGLDYLAKAIQVRGKAGVGWKDPNNYYLRATVYGNQYVELRKPYDAMTDEQKLSDEGKEIRKKINEVLDTKLIPEYARIIATATKPETKGLYDFAKPEFDKLWDFRTGAKEKAADYIKSYVADPSVSSVPVPAKAEDTSNLNAPAAPATAPTPVKLSTGGAPAAQGTANSNGGKSTPAKKGSPKGKKRGRG